MIFSENRCPLFRIMLWRAEIRAFITEEIARDTIRPGRRT
jgi:hypothetical protein